MDTTTAAHPAATLKAWNGFVCAPPACTGRAPATPRSPTGWAPPAKTLTAGTASGDTAAASKAGELRDGSLKDMAGLWQLPGNPSGNPVDVTAPAGM